MKILIKNIKSLVGITKENQSMLRGAEMNNLECLDNAWLAIDNGRIAAWGEMKDWPGISDWRDLEVIDADGKIVLPAWCDSHTHLVFAASREREFEMRIDGKTYEEIAAAGGGILNSARKTQETSEDELFESAMKRLDEIRSFGTGAVEIKSGYGLTPEAELKMLRVVKRLKEASDLTIKATFLGAHAFPAEYKQDHEGYLKQVIEVMLPQVAEEGLADYIDAFCEANYFSVAETERVMEAGAKYGLTPKVHVNQFNAIGGVAACVKHGALSVDHLEVMEASDIEALKGSDTMATALPSCSFFLGLPYAPVREMMDQGLAVALATDFNPGSTPSGRVPFLLSLACLKMKMTPAEAINAATINGAYAMGCHEELGSIAVDKIANLIITKPVSSLAYLPYAFGTDWIDQVILKGKAN